MVTCDEAKVRGVECQHDGTVNAIELYAPREIQSYKSSY